MSAMSSATANELLKDGKPEEALATLREALEKQDAAPRARSTLLGPLWTPSPGRGPGWSSPAMPRQAVGNSRMYHGRRGSSHRWHAAQRVAMEKNVDSSGRPT